MVVLGVMVAVGCGSAVAEAGALGTTNRAISVGGPDGGYWRGIVPFDIDPVFPGVFDDEVEGVLEWAVFAPGKFQLFLDDNAIAAFDPAPGEVVYAYHVSAIAAAFPGVDTVTVGIDQTDVVSTLPTQILTAVLGEEGASGESLQLNTSAAWDFGPSTIDAGEQSSLLLFASPNAPQLDTFQINSGLAAFNGNTPTTMVGSPSDQAYVPEPASMVLWAVGLLALSGIRRRRRLR
jgi:hypothetical protein